MSERPSLGQKQGNHQFGVGDKISPRNEETNFDINEEGTQLPPLNEHNYPYGNENMRDYQYQSLNMNISQPQHNDQSFMRPQPMQYLYGDNFMRSGTTVIQIPVSVQGSRGPDIVAVHYPGNTENCTNDHLQLTLAFRNPVTSTVGKQCCPCSNSVKIPQKEHEQFKSAAHSSSIRDDSNNKTWRETTPTQEPDRWDDVFLQLKQQWSKHDTASGSASRPQSAGPVRKNSQEHLNSRFPTQDGATTTAGATPLKAGVSYSDLPDPLEDQEQNTENFNDVSISAQPHSANIGTSSERIHDISQSSDVQEKDISESKYVNASGLVQQMPEYDSPISQVTSEHGSPTNQSSTVNIKYASDNSKFSNVVAETGHLSPQAENNTSKLDDASIESDVLDIEKQSFESKKLEDSLLSLQAFSLASQASKKPTHLPNQSYSHIIPSSQNIHRSQSMVHPTRNYSITQKNDHSSEGSKHAEMENKSLTNNILEDDRPTEVGKINDKERKPNAVVESTDSSVNRFPPIGSLHVLSEPKMPSIQILSQTIEENISYSDRSDTNIPELTRVSDKMEELTHVSKVSVDQSKEKKRTTEDKLWLSKNNVPPKRLAASNSQVKFLTEDVPMFKQPKDNKLHRINSSKVYIPSTDMPKNTKSELHRYHYEAEEEKLWNALQYRQKSIERRFCEAMCKAMQHTLENAGLCIVPDMFKTRTEQENQACYGRCCRTGTSCRTPRQQKKASVSNMHENNSNYKINEKLTRDTSKDKINKHMTDNKKD